MRLIGLIVALLLVAAPARAQVDDEAKAKILYQRGLAHFQLDEFEVAITLWQEAYRLVPKPQLLYNIAQAYRLSSEKALSYYKKFLAIHPNAPNRAEVEKQIAQLTRQLADDKPAVVPAPVPPLEIKRPAFMNKPAPAVEPTPAPAQLVAAPPEKKKDGVARKGWFWVGMTTMAAAVAVGVGVGVTYGTHSSAPDPTFGVARGNIAAIGRAH
jgi:iron complex outermembrane receptor protein